MAENLTISGVYTHPFPLLSTPILAIVIAERYPSNHHAYYEKLS
jgi:hypothetical protein